MDYEASLDRAMDELPEFAAEESRLDVPSVATQPDGAFTRITNLDELADALSRDAEHVHRYVQSELGTAGQFEDGTGRYNGSFSGEDLDAVVDGYVQEYVLCSECGLPDTRLVTENRTQMLRCDACGAFRPVSKNAADNRSGGAADAVEEGATYEVKITGTGRKGDGVAERGKYTIFVPGTQEGDVVQIYIENVSGTLAFARKA